MATAKPKKKNPRLASGRKRVRQDVKLNAANTSLRSKYRTAVKNVEKPLQLVIKTKPKRLLPKRKALSTPWPTKVFFIKTRHRATSLACQPR